MGQHLELEKTITFEAAHRLPFMPEEHKCRQFHGHTYRLTVTIRGEVGDDGIIYDFADLEEAMRIAVVDECDHNDLNSFLPNPTGESLVIWMRGAVQVRLPHRLRVVRLRLQEGDHNATIWTEDMGASQGESDG
ncbi:hypothetical protein LCGC14_1553620 [marine sediment metagenome]|uniref:6-carboxy-5,6,7,8-tetrahydropterin synthase n=1 Tax=marine sediment metagenome TaxID=412755 RepID=A0A0F9LQG2_9ZZZZ